VVLYGVEADVEFRGDLRVGAALEDESEDLLFLGGEPGLSGGLLYSSRERK